MSITADNVTYLYNENSILIYPNPNNGCFTLSLSNINNLMNSINIYDLSGKFIFSEKLNKNTMEIHLKNVEEGIYTAKIIFAQGIVYKKILVVN